MAAGYRAVQWNAFKKRFDLVVGLAIGSVLAVFAVISSLLNPRLTVETILIRGSAVTAFALLTFILCIGPLARLDRRFLPVLYNRRHLGVAMFVLALFHAVLSTIQFHALGDSNPLVSLLTSYQRDFDPFIRQSANIARFPFEPLGLVALGILFLMAATSHDFWLNLLGASWWKTLHILVLAAYGLIVLHIVYGVLQSEAHIAYPVLLGLSMSAVYGLQIWSAMSERAAERLRARVEEDGYLRACGIDELREGRGLPVPGGRQKLAVFLSRGRVFATSNTCRHQGGPLSEGRIIDGCLTCPWHGWQYRPEDGSSPPPYDERVPIHRTRIVGSHVYVDPEPLPPGTAVEGSKIGVHDHA